MKKRFICLCVLLIALYGCVSTRTFEEAQAVSGERLAALNKALGELAASRAAAEGLKKEIEAQAAEKDKSIASLKAQLDALLDKGDAATRDLNALIAEKGRLLQEGKAKDEEARSLKARLDEEVMRAAETAKAVESLKAELERAAKENDYKDREIERLKLKTGEVSSQKEKELANLKSTYDSLVRELKKEIEKGDVKITRAVDRLSVNMVDKILFDSGSAEIKPEGLKVLKRVGEILRSVADRQIRVEGHTDNVPIVSRIKERFPTNWELSTARGTNVVRYLHDSAGVNPALLSAAGFSEYRPTAYNDTAEGRQRNRRIEIVLLPLDVDRVLEELKGSGAAPK